MKPRYIIPGHGGEFACTEGHEGITTEAVGIPNRCIVLGCQAVTRRVGDKSQAANRLLRDVRARAAARTEAARRANAGAAA